MPEKFSSPERYSRPAKDKKRKKLGIDDVAPKNFGTHPDDISLEDSLAERAIDDPRLAAVVKGIIAFCQESGEWSDFTRADVRNGMNRTTFTEAWKMMRDLGWLKLSGKNESGKKLYRVTVGFVENFG